MISAINAHSKRTSLTVAGIMSGTSADGIDVALLRISPAKKLGHLPRLEILAHAAVSYPAAVRSTVLAVMNAPAASVADLSHLHWRLGQLYARAVEIALHRHPMHLDLIGCHGQTIYHQGTPQRFLGGNVACTWQMGEASVIAARLGVPVVSDFRPADIAAGGQGAPLVPMLDYVLFRDTTRNRVLQNLGGIGNLTVVPANARPQDVFAFDTGPANMVIDALMENCFHRKYDTNGATAARGTVLRPALRKALAHPLFSMRPPKSAGREEFGREFSAKFLALCRRYSQRDEDAVATATALTAHSIAIAWKNYVHPALRRGAETDCIVAGGGAHNRTLMDMLQNEITPLGRIAVSTSDRHGIPAAAKEAVAFALLAWQTWHHQPGNLPRATGASRPVILGRISYA